MKNIVPDLLKTLNKSECYIADDVNNAIVENYYFEIMSKLLHDFRQIYSCLKVRQSRATLQSTRFFNK